MKHVFTNHRQPHDHPHPEDGGRSFHTCFGHTVEGFSESLVLIQLANAVLWAAHLD